MNKIDKTVNNNFIFNWVLKNKLAVGTIPTKAEDINLLKDNNIKNILGLCSDQEGKWHKELEKDFLCNRVVLPDSNKNQLPTYLELRSAYGALKNFINDNITFVHCYASVERSPLLCIMIIMEEYKLSLEESLDYVKKVHSFTNPRNNQLLLIKNFNFL